MIGYSQIHRQPNEPVKAEVLPQITGWHNQSSSIYSMADYLVNGERTGISLSKDQNSYTLWYRGSVYQKGILKDQIMGAVTRILNNRGLSIATQPKATKIGGVSID